MRRIMVAALLAALVLVIVPAAGTDIASAQSGNTWTGYYYNNPDWAGSPVYTETAPYLAFNWGYGSPHPSVPAENFTARYDTDVYFYAGVYRFTATADDEVVLVVNGVPYIDTRGQGKSGKTVTTDIVFSSNTMQQVTVYYREYTHTAYINLSWTLIKSGGS